jgi:hypothetical protein
LIEFVVIIAEKSTTFNEFSNFDEFLAKKEERRRKFLQKNEKSRATSSNRWFFCFCFEFDARFSFLCHARHDVVSQCRRFFFSNFEDFTSSKRC